MREDFNETGPGAMEVELELARALAKYQDLHAGGQSPPPERFVEEYPHISRELAKELGILEELDALVAPSRPPRERFGQFEIIGELEHGGMSIVYEAWQATLERRVALKLLHPSLASDPKAIERFLRESRTLARLSHPNIVTVHAAGLENGTPYLAMELVEGRTLSRLMRQFRLRYALSSVGVSVLSAHDRPIEDTNSPTASLRPETFATPDLDEDADDSTESLLEHFPAPDPEMVSKLYWIDVAEAFAGAAEGLHYAHTQGVFHRDVKPSNLMLTPDGRLRLLDFGVARVAGESGLTRTNERVGTLLYMSPEQVQGKKVGAASDVYSLGATLYEMLVWRPPTLGKTPQEISHRIVHRDPPEPRAVNRHVPRGLETIVLKCLRKKPERRYGSAEALAQDLRRFARGERPEAEPESWSEKLARRLWQRRSLIAQCAAAVSILVMLGSFAWWSYSAAQQNARDAYAGAVCRGLMSLLDAQLLAPGPPLAAVGAQPVNVLSAGDEAPLGIGLLGKKGVESRPGPLLAGPKLFRAGPEPIAEAIDSFNQAIARLPEEPIAHYHLARALLFKGDREAADRHLERVLELEPEFLPALSLRAWSLERAAPDRAKVLQKEVESRAKLEGSRWSPAWLAAQRAVLEKRWAEAAKLFDAPETAMDPAAELYVGHAIDTYLQQGVARLKAGRTSEALVDFGAATAALPDRIGPRILVARAHLSAGSGAAAERELRRLHEAERSASRGDEVALAAAALYRERGEYPTALEWLGRISPGKETIRLLHEADLYLLEKENAKAWAAASKARDREPGNTDVWFMLGNISREDGKPQDARTWYSKVSRQLPRDPRPLVAIAACFELEGQAKEALRILEEAVGLDPASGPAHGELGRVRSLLGDTEGAIKSYERALDLDPGDIFAANNLGTLLDGLGEREAARRYFERAVEVAPDFAHAHYNLGWLFHRERRYQEARAEYETALGLGLDTGLLYSNLGPCLHHLKDLAGAVAAYEAAIERGFTRDSSLYHNHAVALEGLGRNEAAVESYEQAIKLQPGGIYSYYYLGLLHEKMGQLDKAVAAYRRGVDQEPGFRPMQEELARLLLVMGKPPAQGDELAKEIKKFEEAEPVAGPGGAVAQLLEEYRGALAPRLASCRSIDRLFEAPHPLVPEASRWRYLWKPATPPGEGWTGPDFTGDGWEEGEAPFGYPARAGLQTLLDRGGAPNASLFLRASFEVAETASITNLVLTVGSDAAFAAHLNGVEVYRRGLAGEAGTLEATGKGTYDAWRAEEIPLDPRGLTPGRNVLALQAVPAAGAEDSADGHFLVRVRLESSPPPGAAVFDRTQRAYEEFAAVTAGNEHALRLYFEGRLLALSGAPAQAPFEQVLELDRSRPEPYVRLAEEHVRGGDPGKGEEVVRAGLEAGLTGHDSLWDLWLRLRLVDLAEDPREILAAHRSLAPQAEGLTKRQKDVRWLLEKLAAGEPLRINCGGKDGTALGVAWSRDRFFMAGADTVYLEKLDPRRHEIDPLVDKTERYFPDSLILIPGYRIPLPRGTYRVSLRFTEGYHEAPGSRRFDVLLEGKVILEDYSPRFGVAEVHSRVVRVDDGALEIDFKRRVENPKISAIEVLRLE
jgi:serine/threonine protein kinase/Tfp pilus assembly protein PilF